MRRRLLRGSHRVVILILFALTSAVVLPAAQRRAPTASPGVAFADRAAPIAKSAPEAISPAEAGPADIPLPGAEIGRRPANLPGMGPMSISATATVPVISSLVASPTLPRIWGSQITWTANASGGIPPLQYQFVRYSYQTLAWTIVKPYSSSNLFAWTPTQADIGKFVLQVWARNNGSVAAYDAYFSTQPFDILSSAPTITRFTASVGFPRLYGTAITWSVTATGGIPPFQYKFVRYSYQTQRWTVAQDYTTASTFVWTPTAADIGRYALQVWVLNAGSTAAYDAYSGTAAFDIVGPPPTVTTLTSSPAVPSPAGVPLVWTAIATGGVPPLQYEFVRYRASTGVWSVVQPYGASNTFSWIPQPSEADNYTLQVWVKNPGSPNAYDAFKGVSFVISPVAPLVASSVFYLPGLPRPVTTTLAFQAGTSGGISPLTYKFVRYSYTSGTWSVVRDWSANPAWYWTPAPAEAGNYALQVWVRNAGSAAVYDAYAGIGPFTVTPPTTDIVRFLEQATFGPTNADIERVRVMGMSAWIDDQFTTPSTGYPAYTPVMDQAPVACNATCQRDNYSMYPIQQLFFKNALYGQDQLRQRVVWALHQLVVTSGFDLPLPSWYQPYIDVIERNAFGNYRQLLYEVTLNPGMGVYLDMATSTKNNPNENYAREIMQLFSTGTDLLNIDGTPQTFSDGTIIPVYDQFTVTEFARLFSGWRLANPISSGITNYRDQMVPVGANHDLGSKTLLNGFTTSAGAQPLQDLNDGIDNLFNHPNMGPYLAKHMIRYLVTSNPTPAYVQRIATIFNDNGSGVRGDLKAVVKAILLDPEARTIPANPDYGHLKEPALYMTHFLRAMNATSVSGALPSDGVLAAQAQSLGQDVLRPPTVFSYYPADYLVPGSSTVAGPEFALMQTTTTLRRANFMNTMVFSNIPVGANSPQGTSIGMTINGLAGLAGNPDMLLKELDRLLLHDTMSAQMKTSLLGAINAISSSNPLLRAQTALYLVATSSQYQVER